MNDEEEEAPELDRLQNSENALQIQDPQEVKSVGYATRKFFQIQEQKA